MTVVIGALLPQGIVMAADSRGVEVIDGEVRYYRDDLQKAYWVPPYVVGMAGNALVGSWMLNVVRKVCADQQRVIARWSLEERETFFDKMLKNIYETAADTLGSRKSVSFLYGTLDPGVYSREEPPSLRAAPSGVDTFLGMTASRASHCFAFLKTLSLPSGKTLRIDKLDYIAIGSGQVFEEGLDALGMTLMGRPGGQGLLETLRNRPPGGVLIDYLPSHDISEIWASLCARVKTFFLTREDKTFNELLHGFAIRSDGVAFVEHLEDSPFKREPLICHSPAISIHEFVCKDSVKLSTLTSAIYRLSYGQPLRWEPEHQRGQLDNFIGKSGIWIGKNCAFYLGMTYCDDVFWVLDFIGGTAFPLQSGHSEERGDILNLYA